jgi:predicted nucleic-acid-binding protein
VKITPDTNVRVRAMTGDDARQSRIAQRALASAEMVSLALPALCELVWVLARGYKVAATDIAAAIRRLIDAANVAVNRPAVAAGLAVLEAGGDFADGVIAYEGNWLGAEAFVSFDRKAVELVQAHGHAAKLLA